MNMSLKALGDLDRGLEAEVASLHANLVNRLKNRTGVETLRVREDGDETHAFDAFAEARLLAFFERSKLPIRFSSEERDDIDLVSSPELIAVVDPLDGSDMLARGYPLCSVSVAIVELESQEVVLSRILDVSTGIQYSVGLDGAMRGKVRARPTDTAVMGDSFVVAYAATASRLGMLAKDLSRFSPKLFLNYGGPLDIARVGSGQCDAFVETWKGFLPRDMVAGVHFATSAGATALGIDGRPLRMAIGRDERTKFIVASTPALAHELLEVFIDVA